MKIYNFKFTTSQRILLITLLLIIAVIYSFTGIFFGIDFTDSFYHLNQALNPANGIYLYPFLLSSYLIKGIIKIAGAEVINLRVINWLLLLSSMILPFIFLKVNSKKSHILFYIAITLFLYTPLNANILGYDTLSILSVSLIFSLTALYIKTRAIFLIPFISLIVSASILIRLPNLLAIPIIFLFLLYSEGFRNKECKVKFIINPGAFVILTVLFIIAGYSLYYDNWEQFVVATSNSNSHNILLLFLNYLKDGLKLGGFVILILLGWVGYKKFLPKSSSLVKDGIFVLIFMFCFSFFVGYTKFSVNYALFLVALAISMVVIQIYYLRNEKVKGNLLISLLFLFFLFINPFGSNTGLLKAYSLFLLLPFILSILGLKEKKFWFILVAVLLPFAVLTKIFGIYEDKNLLALDEKLQIEELSPILTNGKRQEYLNKIDIVVRELEARDVEIFFYGDKSHIFHYLYPKTFLNIMSFFQPVDDLIYFQNFESVILGKDQVAFFVIDSYPINSASSSSLLEQELIKLGFHKVEDGSVYYYLRTLIK